MSLSLIPRLNTQKAEHSTSEVEWSRGSDPSTNRSLFKKKPNLYRYECEGVLVYDVKAKLAGQEAPRESPPSSASSLSSALKRELESLTSQGNDHLELNNFVKVRNFPGEPNFFPEYTLEIPPDPDILKFDSKFECGNLHKAVRLSKNDYLLILDKDSENAINQWYYFSVTSTFVGEVTFKIINLGKFGSLYNQGMLPLIKSLKKGGDWFRGGTNIKYFPTAVSGYEGCYTLAFNYRFEELHDTVYFAFSYPYTYQELNTKLDELREKHSDIARVNTLCETVTKNPCYFVTITNNIESYTSFYEESYMMKISAPARRLFRRRENKKKAKNKHSRKKGIVITARVHSGETVSSFMMEGILDFLVSNSQHAHILRENFVFKVVPMLNPDGVRYGNNRASLLGVDLNRRWAQPNKLAHPTIYYTKKMMQVFGESHSISMFCDLHGHATKRNIFMYGCKSTAFEDKRKNILAKVIPVLMGEQTDLFSFKDSHFRMEKCKESTARIVVYKEFGVVNSYTMEASFYGPESISAFPETRSDLHMVPQDLQNVASCLCKLALNFMSARICSKKIIYVTQKLLRPSKKIEETKIEEFQNCQESTGEFKDILEREEIWKGIEQVPSSDEESSESSPSDIEEVEPQPQKPFQNPTPPITENPKPSTQRKEAFSAKRIRRAVKPIKREKSRTPMYLNPTQIQITAQGDDYILKSNSSETYFQRKSKTPMQSVRSPQTPLAIKPIRSKINIPKHYFKSRSPLPEADKFRTYKVSTNFISSLKKQVEKSPLSTYSTEKTPTRPNKKPGIEEIYQSWIKNKNQVKQEPQNPREVLMGNLIDKEPKIYKIFTNKYKNLQV